MFSNGVKLSKSLLLLFLIRDFDNSSVAFKEYKVKAKKKKCGSLLYTILKTTDGLSKVKIKRTINQRKFLILHYDFWLQIPYFLE